MTPLALVIGAIGGLLTGWWGNETVMIAAGHTATIIKNLLELVSLPVIFLSIVSSLASMESGRDARLIGGRVLRYTVATTLIAADRKSVV